MRWRLGLGKQRRAAAYSGAGNGRRHPSGTSRPRGGAGTLPRAFAVAMRVLSQ